MKRTALTPAVLALAAGSALAGGAPPLVIYSEIPGDPTAQAPGLGIEFTAMLSLYGSPNGQHWIFKAFVDDAENDVIVVGFGLTGTVVAKEAELTGLGDGTSHNFLDSDCGINDLGQYVYGSRLDGATSGTDEIAIAGDGGGETAAFREGDLAPGLFDTGATGDETYGNSLNSVSRLADGTVCVRADSINNIDSNFESALYIGSSVAAQEGTMATTGETLDSFVALSGNTFSVSPDGAHWIVEADIDPSFTSMDAVLVDGAIVLKAGDILAEGPSNEIDGVFSVEMAPNNDWYARGDYTDDTDWIVRNGKLIAFTGGAVDAGDFENWGAVLTGVTGNINGDYIITGDTDNPDPAINNVMSLNGQQIVAREGDGVDLDGNGMADDNAEIASFSAEDLILATDGTIYAFVTLREAGGGTGLGDAFIRILPGAAPCNGADLAEPFGQLDFSDVSAFLVAFGAMEAAADLALPMGQWDFSDVVEFLNLFGAGCP